MRTKSAVFRAGLVVAVAASCVAPVLKAQAPAPAPTSPAQPRSQTPTPAAGANRTPPPAPAGTAANELVVPPDYVIGADDLLSVVYWNEKDLSGDVVVRPDGKISLPLVNDIVAAGLTPEELRLQVIKAAERFLAGANITVVVRQINSRKVSITGEIARPGMYAMAAQMNILQLIALAGGLGEYADQKNIRIMRTENGRSQNLTFNYKDASKGKLDKVLELKPGDFVLVP